MPCDLNATVERVELPWAAGSARRARLRGAAASAAGVTRAKGKAEFMIKASGIDLVEHQNRAIVMVEISAMRDGGIGGASIFSSCEDTEEERALPRTDVGVWKRERPLWRCGRRGLRWGGASSERCL